jgi:hypothetical protein
VVRTSPPLLLCRAAFVAAFVVAQAPARAEDAPADPTTEARRQFDEGTAAFRERRFVEAALHFEAAAAQRPHAVTLFTAALAWEQANEPARACDDFARALDVPGLSAQQATTARDRLAALEKSLGTLLVTAPDGWRVQLEGLSEIAAPARLHGAPGVHKLLVRAPGRPIARHDVTLDVGEFTRLELDETQPEATPEAAAVPPGVAPPEPHLARRLPFQTPLGFAVIGVGTASLVAGIVLGLQALDARDAYDAGPTHATYDHAQSLQTWSTVAFATGAVCVAGGVALVLLSREAARTPALAVAPAPLGARLVGVF